MSITVGTNCPQGGDAGYGGRTVLSLEDRGGTSWGIKTDEKLFESPQKIEIVFGGDDECENLISALEFAVTELKK